MAEEVEKVADIHESGGAEGLLPWLPTCVLNDGIEVCEKEEHHYSMNTSIMAEEADEIADNHESGGAEGLPWLPTYVLNDRVEVCEKDDHHYSKKRSYNKHRHQPPLGRKSAAAQPPLLPSPPNWKSFSKPDQRPKHFTNWAVGGPGMQAVFLDSGPRSCGTGVFLPRTSGTDVEKTRKPAFAPVLLPSRVVQALNLNVHGLGLQIKPRDHNNKVKGSESERIRNKKSSHLCVISQNRNSSPEIFLPKEWTY